MHTRNSTYIKSKSTDLDSFIEYNKSAGMPDYSNSELLYKLDKNLNWKEYLVTKYEHRIDLISEDIYGSDNYQWLLLYVNRISIFEIKRGIKLKYIPIDTLQSIINSI